MENNYTFVITDVAKKDISDSLDYIAENLCNKKAADELYVKISNALSVIHNFPLSQAKSSLVPQFGGDLRKYPIDNYILYYTVKQTQITVLRFIYAGRNIDEKYF